MPEETWDAVVVGAGPAGSATALGLLRARPGSRVLLLDRADFPRDKACGDGVAPHVLDVLAAVGVSGLLDDRVPVERLRLQQGADGSAVVRRMRRPAYVVPRTELDARLVRAATEAGAVLRRERVREVRVAGTGAGTVTGVTVDGLPARIVVGADGAHSLVRVAAGLPPVRRRALALRGYAPVSGGRERQQVIAFADGPWPAYAWSFDRGDGWANVGYGSLLRPGQPAPQRAALVAALERLLPGAAAMGEAWRGHHLPLSSAMLRLPRGRVLLAGDAAGLVNPLTGEGLYYAVAGGVLAGRAAAAALDADGGRSAGERARRSTTRLLGRHLRHTALAARVVGAAGVAEAAVRAAGTDQRVFDDLVELGLGQGRLTRRVLAGLGAALAAEAGRSPRTVSSPH